MAVDHASCDSVGCILQALGRTLVGAGLVLLGGLMTITLWLLPLGVPFALLGVAVILSTAPITPGFLRDVTLERKEMASKREPSSESHLEKVR